MTRAKESSMRADVLAEVLDNLRRDYGFTAVGDWLRRGKCPSCGAKEVFTHAEGPWVLKCARENKCGWSASTRELYPDAFGRFNERFPATTQNPTATADAYMAFVRGFQNLGAIKGWYRQGHFSHPKGSRSTATVVFDIDRENGIFFERLIDTVRIPKPDGEIEERKANFEGKNRGLSWQPPGQVVKDGELWLVEGCIDAICLKLKGIQVAAALSSVNFPQKLLDSLNPKTVTLVWALDNDKSGNTYTHKHIKMARDMGFECRAAVIPQKKGIAKTDWNDVWKARELEPEHLELYRFHGDLLTAASAVEKGVLIWARHKSTSFAVEYRARTFWFFLSQEAFAAQVLEMTTSGQMVDDRGVEFAAALKVARVSEIANCAIKFLYFQQNVATDEAWYYTRITFPHGRHEIKNTFTGSQVAAASEFKKRLLSIAPGALYQGGSKQLDWIVGRYLDDIKIVETVDFIGYSKEHRVYVFPDKAVAGGKVHDINDEDFFEVGKVSIKSLNSSLPLVIGTHRDYDPTWIEHVWNAYGPRGIIAAAYWLGSLFSEQIRERHKSFMFLEVVGEASAGKSTLIEFCWKLVGRNDYEGFDPNKSTVAARARIMSQVSGLPVCMIESDRGGEDTAKVRQFDWDELKTAYNGRPSRATGVKNNGNDTREPPFRGSIVISQNNAVCASEAILQRIVHLYFTCASHTPASKLAADALASIPVEKVSHFLLMATQAEAAILEMFHERALKYEAQVLAMPEVKHIRIAKNHGQMMALVDALATLVKIPADWRTETMKALGEAAAERQRAIANDHPMVEEFWEIYDYLGADKLNHARDPGVIAISLPHLQRVAAQYNQPLAAMLDLKKHLKTSQSRPFITIKAVNSNMAGFDDKTVKCWVFGLSKRSAHD